MLTGPKPSNPSNRVLCQICGEWRAHPINAHVISIHGRSVAEYERMGIWVRHSPFRRPPSLKCRKTGLWTHRVQSFQMPVGTAPSRNVYYCVDCDIYYTKYNIGHRGIYEEVPKNEVYDWKWKHARRILRLMDRKVPSAFGPPLSYHCSIPTCQYPFHTGRGANKTRAKPATEKMLNSDKWQAITNHNKRNHPRELPK